MMTNGQFGAVATTHAPPSPPHLPQEEDTAKAGGDDADRQVLGRQHNAGASIDGDQGRVVSQFEI